MTENVAPPPAHPPTSPDSFIGIVVEDGRESKQPYHGSPFGLVVWTFSAQAVSEGQLTEEVSPIEVRGQQITGAMPRRGQWVEIEPRQQFRSGRGFRPKVVRNLSTGDVIRVPIYWDTSPLAWFKRAIGAG